ncbi:MAG: hypothetical protein IKU48_05130 [Clostridia bacterium]|nr:hypothetical protein [Clostridia bacterium]
MTDEAARAELERLLPVSYEMNEIFWGKGLAYTEDGSNNRYMAVNEDCGYKTIDEIITKASEVFSEEYIAIIKDAIFTDSDDIDPRYIEVEGKLLADKKNEGFNIQGNIKIDSVVIKRQNKGMVLISAEYEDGGKTELTLVLQDGRWFLNSSTY